MCVSMARLETKKGRELTTEVPASIIVTKEMYS